jgi:hypothetical protein
MSGIALGLFFGTGIGIWLGHIFWDLPPKGKTIKELSDDELKVVALSFIHDLTEEIEKREKNERGKMQEENKPFEEFNGKE